MRLPGADNWRNFPAGFTIGSESGVEAAESYVGARTHEAELHALLRAYEFQAPIEGGAVDKQLTFTFPQGAKFPQATGHATEEWPILVDEGKQKVGTGSLSPEAGTLQPP